VFKQHDFKGVFIPHLVRFVLIYNNVYEYNDSNLLISE